VLATAWLVGTAAAVTLSVVAVNLAGTRVGDHPSLPLSRRGIADALSATAPPSTATQSTTPSGAQSPSPGAPATTSRATTPRVPSGPGAAVAAAGATTSSTMGETGTDPPLPTSTTQPAVPSSTRSASAIGGTIRVQCIGSSLTLLSAVPVAGYHTQIGPSSGDQLLVKFVGDDHTSQITANCSSGSISFSIAELGDN
jgi:hypothetical protein